MVRIIFVLMTVPVKIRPRIETSPVNGHFLSMYVPSMAYKRLQKKNSKLVIYFKIFQKIFQFVFVRNQRNGSRFDFMSDSYRQKIVIIFRNIHFCLTNCGKTIQPLILYDMKIRAVKTVL